MFVFTVIRVLLMLNDRCAVYHTIREMQSPTVSPRGISQMTRCGRYLISEDLGNLEIVHFYLSII